MRHGSRPIWLRYGDGVRKDSGYAALRAITFLAARRCDQLTALCVTCVFDGPINGEGFRAYVNQQPVPTGFAAQFGLRLDFPLPQTDLAYGHCLGNTRSSEAIQDRGADLDHRNMPIKVASDNMLESRWESLSYTHL